MKRVLIFYFLFSTIFFFSCVRCNDNDSIERLQHENDSLRALQVQIEDDFELYFSVMNDIADNLDRVKSIGGYLITQTSTEVVGEDAKTRIDKNLDIVANLIQQNNEKISYLKNKLETTQFNKNALEKRINKLIADNSTLVQEIVDLQDQLKAKSEIIMHQNALILSADIAQKEAEITESILKQQLAHTTEQLYKGWYVFGSENELKLHQVIDSKGIFASGKVLLSDFNKDYFVQVDIREISRIPLYTRHAKVLTTHPVDSYVLEKEDKTYVLTIVDKEQFWSVSRYLVIKTN